MTSWNRNAFVILAVLVSSTALAQVEGVSPMAARRARIVSVAQKGAPFRAGTLQSYRVVVGLRALHRDGAAGEARVASLGLPVSGLVEVKGPYVIVQQAPSGATPPVRLAEASAVAVVSRTQAYPVVQNTATGELAILPGSIVAKLRDPADAAAIAEANGLSLSWVGQLTAYGYFRVPEGGDVVSAAAALARDPRVETAYPEVSESFAHPL